MEKALIVDDDQLITHAMARALHPYYPEVKAVSNGTEALHEISSSAYHTCFLDIALQGISGLQLLKRIQELSPDTKVVIMTGIAIDDDMRKEFEESCFCFLAKPFEISDLKTIARQALGRSGEESYTTIRRSKRTPLKKPVNYSITLLELGKPISLSLKGDIVDINESGIGLRTYYPLEPGHLLMFTSGVERADQKVGVVKWSTVTDGSYLYRVGIEFMREGLPPQEGAN
jgi:CheY-like chemotaxis protein